MSVVSTAVDLFTKSNTGLIANKTEAMTSIGKRLQSRIDTEEIRINRYADQLRKQFTQMDTAVAGWNAQANYLARF